MKKKKKKKRKKKKMKKKQGKEEAEEEEYEKHKEIKDEEDEKDSVIKQNHKVKFFLTLLGKTDQQNRAVFVEFSSNSKSSQNI